jgi:hypothetical protein
MCDTARATSSAVTLYKVVVGSASRRRSGDIDTAALASLIFVKLVDLERTLGAENRIHFKAGAIESGTWTGKELLKHRIV